MEVMISVIGLIFGVVRRGMIRVWESDALTSSQDAERVVPVTDSRYHGVEHIRRHEGNFEGK
jgi:hypothetical protein